MSRALSLRQSVFNKPVLAWCLYDWANSAFATTVLAGFFPLFFKQYWSSGLSSTESTFHLGLGNALASLVIMLCAPLLGAIADRGGLRKRFLLLFTASGVAATAALAGAGQGEWPAALALFAAANIGFMGAIIFYDALLITVSRTEDVDLVSALGFALGYLGGGILFAVNVAMTLSPQTFGLADATSAVRLSFITVAVWWAVFSLPLLLVVRETPPAQGVRGWAVARSGYRQLVTTVGHVRQLRPVLWFLLAYWLYIDGVDTVVRMAVDYGLAIGLEHTHLIIALLITQFVGFPAALAFGYFARHLGPGALGARNGIYIAILVYLATIVYAFFMDSSREFYLLAVAIGLVQGGIQGLSRSLYARLIPADKSAEFFGFYNMLGKFAAIIGPLIVGAVAAASGSHRWGILSVTVLFVLGAWLLSRVDVAAAERAARG